MLQSLLVIDDSPDTHALLRIRLKPEALVLHHAFSGDDGIDKAVELKPDLILLDLDLPDMSGLDVCRRLKSEEQTASLPIIFLTGMSDVRAKVHGFDLGAVDYVTKPFDPAELRARVRAALRGKRYLDMLAIKAQVDGLTGLWNRSYFDRRLHEELAAANRHGRRVSVALLDLDHFKAINDEYGHPFGDRVLQTFGEVLSSRIRASDAACRYGGEELAVIFTETGLDGATRAAEQLRERLAACEFEQRGKIVRVTASVGVSSTESMGKVVSTSLLVSAADEALYAAKAAGRNRVAQAEPSAAVAVAV